MSARRLDVLLRSYFGARRRFRRLRGQALEAYQDRKAQQIVEYARRHSRFFREYLDGWKPTQWREMPTVDKSLMMARFDDYNTAGITRDMAMDIALRAERERDFSPTVGGLTVGISSGTSGHRGLFLVGPEEQAAWAGHLLARIEPRFQVGGYRVAFFLRSNSNLYQSLRSRWVDFRYFDLTVPVGEAVATLNAQKPHLLAGPPSLLSMLAESAQRGDLRIRPERLFSFAEVLDPEDRTRIAEAFDCRVDQAYQCTEGLMALSCPRGSLHVQEDLVAVQTEPLGGGRFTPIVTDLRRRVQPIIRYRLNDVLVFDPNPCPCGSAFRVIARIEGRRDDLCRFPTWDGSCIVFPDTLRRAILLAGTGIREFLAVQERPGALRVHLDTESDASYPEIAARVEESLRRELAAVGCRIEQLDLHPGVPVVVPGTKRRRIICVEGSVGTEGPDRWSGELSAGSARHERTLRGGAGT
jgi:putative adenylate-forming enzyme